jgi:hypothetical protein
MIFLLLDDFLIKKYILEYLFLNILFKNLNLNKKYLFYFNKLKL